MVKKVSPNDELTRLHATLREDATQVSRRSFLLSSGVALTAGRVVANLPLALADETAEDTAQEHFTARQTKTLTAVCEHLFPKGPDSPGATDIHALAYIEFTIFRPGMNAASRNFLLKRIATVHEASQERFGKAFNALDFSQRESLLQYFAQKTHWGENWLALVLGYILEALLSDPVYGGNPDGIGWRWLEHQPGFPRPPKDKIYTRLKSMA